MYNIDSVLLQKLNSDIQTPVEGSDPRIHAYITRNRTPINTQKLWDRHLITSTVGTRSSIAVRRPVGMLEGDLIVTAQIESQGAVVLRSAKVEQSFSRIEFHGIPIEIPPAKDIALCYDGDFLPSQGKIEFYTQGELPWLFYIDYSNTLFARDLNSNKTITVAQNAIGVDAVRGVRGATSETDDGIIVFWISRFGVIHEGHIVEGALKESGTAVVPPSENQEGAWVDIWASRTFDYRICLQLLAVDGRVYTLVSKSRPAGHALRHYITISRITAKGRIGKIPPVFVSAENIPTATAEGQDWGIRIKMTFDGRIHNVTDYDTKAFMLTDYTGKVFKPDRLGYGDKNNEVLLVFEKGFNNSLQPFTLKCTGVTYMGSEDLPIVDFSYSFHAKNLRPAPSLHEYVAVSEIKAAGEVKELSEEKAYFNDAVRITNIKTQGEVIKPSFFEGFLKDYVSVSDISAVGEVYYVGESPV